MRLGGRTNGASWVTPRLAPVLIVCIAGLGVANLVQIGLDAGFGFSAKKLLPLFDLSQEESVGTWFSTLLLTAAALAAAALALAARPASALRRGWLALAAFLVLLSLDETAAVHGRLSPIVRDVLGLSSELFLAWVIPAGLVVVAFALWQRRFFGLLPWRLRERLLLAAVIYFGAALGFEVVETVIAVDTRFDAESVLFSSVEAVEEVLEMAGAAVGLLALLEHLRAVAPTWTITVRFDDGPPPDRRRPTRDEETGLDELDDTAGVAPLVRP